MQGSYPQRSLLRLLIFHLLLHLWELQLVRVSPSAFLISTKYNAEVTSNISASIDKTPFFPSLRPSKFSKPLSILFTFNLKLLAVSISREMMTDAGCLEVNLASFLLPESSNKPERSNPQEREIISKAFNSAGLMDPSSVILLLEGPGSPPVSTRAVSLPSCSGCSGVPQVVWSKPSWRFDSARALNPKSVTFRFSFSSSSKFSGFRSRAENSNSKEDQPSPAKSHISTESIS
ncbi:hypothetical protein Cgig2_023956 [Carnegiea gigantea]|uniref:ATP synthase protein MI25 n=1 Tax=Carnegiea gigantea TaxID=171969 RepID=A0A9Q1QG02_9CARY|nr:hypothetical protein Cgig2_023956 [Carnegiea gigantea]